MIQPVLRYFYFVFIDESGDLSNIVDISYGELDEMREAGGSAVEVAVESPTDEPCTSSNVIENKNLPPSVSS
jgi:hypothetical protein